MSIAKIPIKIAKKAGSTFLSGAYTIGRKGGWLIYTTVPTASYFLTKEILDWKKSFSFYNPMGYFIKLFGSNEIERAENIKELSEKGIGLSFGFLTSKLTNLGTEYILPNFCKLRRSLETALYTASAIAVNTLASSKGELKSSLESIVKKFSSEESFTDGINQTAKNALTALDNIASNLDTSTIDNLLKYTSASLFSLALYRLSEIFFPNPVTKARDRYIKKHSRRPY